MMSLQVSDLPAEASIETQEQPRLLVVDDEVTTAQALQLYLTRQGYDVRVAYSGQRALEEIAVYHPHLLILDLMMPDISGLEITMRVRSDARQSYLPIIMITGQDQERKRLQSMVSGADDYLAKPVNKLELLVRVQALIRTKSHIDRLWAENHALLSKLEARNAELEQALLAVEEANILKRNILHTVSHEMGTPMLQIKSAVHLMLEDIRKTDPDNLPASLVTQAVARLEGIIHNLTELARSENLKNEPFVLSDAVDLSIRIIDRTLFDGTPDQRIRRVFEENIPLVSGDRRAVSRVLKLLLDNAFKFDPEGHPVSVKAERVGDHAVRVSVQDQGIGIAEDQLDRVFEEFYQVDSSTTRRFGGSGVGLALAKLLCNQMHTKLEVESQPGKGSTFSFLLPVADL